MAAIAAVGAAGGGVVLSGCGSTASAGSIAASVAGYIPASSPVYVQVSTDTTGAQWAQLIDLAQMFPSYGTMEKELKADLAREGISWEKDLRPLLGEAAALATTKMPDTAAVTKGALTGIPQVENLVGGQITGAAAMSLTAQPDGLRMKAVLVDTPPMTDQKAYTPTLMKNAPADSVAYLGFNRLADTVEQALKSAESSSSADTKKQIDTVLAQAPLLLGVDGADLKNLTGGEHAVVVTDGEAMPGVSLALKTGNGAQATSTLTSLSKAIPVLMSTFGGAKGSAKGSVAVDLNGVKGQKLSIGKSGNVVWGVKGDLAVIGNSAAGAGSVLAPKAGATLADSKAFQDATQGMPDQVTGLGLGQA